jgi:hypothetical protein
MQDKIKGYQKSKKPSPGSHLSNDPKITQNNTAIYPTTIKKRKSYKKKPNFVELFA